VKGVITNCGSNGATRFGKVCLRNGAGMDALSAACDVILWDTRACAALGINNTVARLLGLCTPNRKHEKRAGSNIGRFQIPFD
jgi:hypothetical protein